MIIAKLCVYVRILHVLYMCMFIYSNSVGNIYSNNHCTVYGVFVFIVFISLARQTGWF